MLLVKEIMTTDLITVGPDTEVSKAATLLLDNHINGAPVVDSSGKLVGILCQSDLIFQQKKLSLPSFFTFLDGFIPLTGMKEMEKEIRKVSATTVEQVMTPDPVTVQTDTPVQEVASLMVEKRYHTIPVMEGGALVGILGKEDVLRTVLPRPEETAGSDQ
jgi:CBS domain-containing protein